MYSRVIRDQRSALALTIYADIEDKEAVECERP